MRTPETELYKGSKKQKLLEDLLESANLQFGDGKEAPEFSAWVQNITLDGRPFNFEKHEYLVEPYQDDHPDQTEIKAAQMGLTSKAILRACYKARFADYRGILYLFPSRSDVSDFSKGRIDPLINDNPESIGQWIRDTDAANIKRIWNCFLYLRGMRARAGLKSVPIDFTIFDELDESPAENVQLAMERMSHSEHKQVLKLSNPTTPDFGIDKEFQMTDQRYWLLKCPACNEYICLEETFPDCLLETSAGVIRACIKCRHELNPSIGEWVAKYPGVTDKRGYSYSQLFSHFVDPGEILHQFRTTNNLTDFFNLKIGKAYVDAMNRLTVQEVLNLCTNEGISSQDKGPTYMGIDQGKVLHVVIGKQPGKIIYIGVHKDFEELDRLMNLFNVSRCVIDAMPEIRNARAFAERHRGRVYLNYYSESQRGNYSWNDRDFIVSVNRTESLDASHNEILFQKITLPRESDIVREFAAHCHNTAKRLEEDESGGKKYVYLRLGADHFRHAFNYECIARHYGAGSFFADSDLR